MQERGEKEICKNEDLLTKVDDIIHFAQTTQNLHLHCLSGLLVVKGIESPFLNATWLF